jgi:hypothetical protein
MHHPRDLTGTGHCCASLNAQSGIQLSGVLSLLINDERVMVTKVMFRSLHVRAGITRRLDDGRSLEKLLGSKRGL